MERETITRERLLEMLNGELARMPEYGSCRYNDVTRLSQPDETGCNWGDAVMQCDGLHTHTVQPAAFRMLKDMKGRYNLQ